MNRSLLIGLCTAVALAIASPAAAYWPAGGSGSGSAAGATMPAGNQPSATVLGQRVTLTWAQSGFQGSPLGSYGGGGYTVKRYAEGTASGAQPGGTCATTVAGATATLQCVDGDAPIGRWQYTVTPILNSFTGDEGPRSATVTVAPDAPALDAVAAQNPPSGQATGGIELSWGAVAGVAGYNIYRRTTSGSYDFSRPLNGATPYVAGTTYTDPGDGLSGGTTYAYVVRAVAGSPAIESASSTERSATAIARPAAPTGLSAAAAVAARIDLSWSAVAGVAGYNVYRRTAAGAYDFSAPLNGSIPVSATTFTDTTSTDGATYVYAVRAVITGGGGAQVESASSADSAAATADGIAPPAPTGVTVTNGGPVLSAALCGVASGTRYINRAGQAAVSVTATIPTPEANESVLFSATTPGSSPVTATVAAPGTSVSATLNLTTLLDGVVTLTARTRDAAGNLSATTSPTNTSIKDVVAPPLDASYNAPFLVGSPTVSGSAECGAGIRATETSGLHEGTQFPAGGAYVIASGTAYSFTVEGPPLLGTVRYDVTATDMAGNLSAPVAVSS